MNKKGFTLIELLAVIVILAIIAVITAPTILGVIEGARKDAAKDKAWGTIHAVDLAYAQDQIQERKYKLGTPVTFNNKKASVGTTSVKASGELPESGTVIIREDGSIIAQNLKFKDYTCSTVKSETDNTIDPNNVECVKREYKVVYRWSRTSLKIGDSIEGISTVADYTKFGSLYFLKHEVEDNKITASEVCFIKDGNMHCLKPKEYETSKAKLLEIFGEDACYVDDSYVNCVVSGVIVLANSDGSVRVQKENDRTRACEIGSYGYSYCYFGPE